MHLSLYMCLKISVYIISTKNFVFSLSETLIIYVQFSFIYQSSSLIDDITVIKINNSFVYKNES